MDNFYIFWFTKICYFTCHRHYCSQIGQFCLNSKLCQIFKSQMPPTPNIQCKLDLFTKKEAGAPLPPIFCQKDSKLTTFIRKYVNICNQSHLIKCRSSSAQSLSRIIFASFPPLVSRGPPIMQCNALPCTSRLATHNVYSSKALTEISQTKRDQQTAIKWSFKIKTSLDIFFHLFFMFIGWKLDNQVALFPLITKSQRLIVIPLLAPPGWSSTRTPCDALLIKRDVSKYRMQQICIIEKEGF